ncbi:MAG TPA: hypothetical protein DD619_01570 [Alphaproteobacteria bacterium]|nr:hypothetical protein [Alphaproteobacteria bacterium]
MKKILVLLAVLFLSQPVCAQKWNWTPRHAKKSAAQTAAFPAESPSPAAVQKTEDYSEENAEEEIGNLIFTSRKEFNKADTNGDGKISEDEFLLFQENDFIKIAAKNFIDFDLNRDGKISQEEILTRFRQNEDYNEDESAIAQNFKEADIDSSGFLDKTEFQHYQQTSLLNNNKQIFRLFDANGDGAVTYEETEQILGVFQNLADE